ncbi:hypothetical protein JRQ81_016071 [Phrynocephalus forsythii]|uniref:Uncharacterized protein n=1 Tax=Phrynocephalus forsythii TaxID=171643 RepID=A0A9Q1B2W0_9SAUR|nr:hypothetical protein JRQ81_016071 [Phrynocephalus forsythii]
MRAPRNTTQFIMHQVYEDMRQEEKRAAAAKKREEDEAEGKRMEENDSNIVSASSSCMATILAMAPERDTLGGDEEIGLNVCSQKSQTYKNVDMECHLSISCEP